jgi:pyruvate kinase
VATTRSGSTAIQICRYRPAQSIIALCPDEAAARRLALYWGCTPRFMPMVEETDKMIEAAAAQTVAGGHARKGEKLVITAGRPIWEAGTTNMLWVKDL